MIAQTQPLGSVGVTPRLDGVARRQALAQLKHPAPMAWDQDLADRMLSLTAESIGAKLQPWSDGLVSAVKICQPALLETMDAAQHRVDNAYRAQDMQALGRACGTWFAACKAVWDAGGGR